MHALRAWGALAAAAMLALGAGCGGGDDDDGAAIPESAPATAESGDGEVPGPAVGTAAAQRKLAAALPEVPVWLPAPLPPGTRVETVDIHREGGEPYAQVQLDMGEGGPLQLQYGRAAFDGCPTDVRPATVAGQQALIARATPPGELTTVIWPVRDSSDPGSPGVYGVGGELPPKRILDLAVSMSRYALPAPAASPSGC
jgi:hypothetical protein